MLVAILCNRFLCIELQGSLTLFLPGEVKVDLADINVKFRENFLCTLFIIKKTIPA
jgi:hypothetical protein